MDVVCFVSSSIVSVIDSIIEAVVVNKVVSDGLPPLIIDEIRLIPINPPVIPRAIFPPFFILPPRSYQVIWFDDPILIIWPFSSHNVIEAAISQKKSPDNLYLVPPTPIFYYIRFTCNVKKIIHLSLVAIAQQDIFSLSVEISSLVMLLCWLWTTGPRSLLPEYSTYNGKRRLAVQIECNSLY
jgi:hypothetical protein